MHHISCNILDFDLRYYLKNFICLKNGTKFKNKNKKALLTLIDSIIENYL